MKKFKILRFLPVFKKASKKIKKALTNNETKLSKIELKT